MRGVRIALVHDWLTGMRGGERCLEVFGELYPDADLFTLLHVPGIVSGSGGDPSEANDRRARPPNKHPCALESGRCRPPSEAPIGAVPAASPPDGEEGRSRTKKKKPVLLVQGARTGCVECHVNRDKSQETDLNGRHTIRQLAERRMKIVTVLVGIAFITLGVATVATGGPFEDFVTGLYQLVLSRTPSPGEVTLYASYYSQHPGRAGVGNIVNGFFGSQEFIDNIRFTPATYTTILYQAVLDRAPDPVGLSGFSAAVTEGLISIVPDFIGSAEFQGLGVQNAAATFVQRLYVEALGRSPSGGEEGGWIALVAAGQSLTVVRGILASAEYAATARTLADHVTILYRGILGRQPGPVEVQGWAHVLVSRLARISDA